MFQQKLEKKFRRSFQFFRLDAVLRKSQSFKTQMSTSMEQNSLGLRDWRLNNDSPTGARESSILIDSVAPILL